MSDNIARDIELLNDAALGIVDAVSSTMEAGGSIGAEVSNTLEEALGHEKREIWRCIAAGEAALDEYNKYMMMAVDRINRIIGRLSNM